MSVPAPAFRRTLKIMRPDIFITLADGLNKRITFLKELTAQLGLEAEAIHTRAEDLGKTRLSRTLRYATARRVASLTSCANTACRL
jgi:16S rRNA (guanine527-N7)-methyltransferase